MALLAAYNFDEASGNVLDVSGNGRDFALNANLIRTVSGHTNGGVTKNGAGFPVVASPSFVGTSAWTIMFWRQGLGDTPWWARLYNISADTGSGIVLLSGGTSLNIRIRTPGGSNVQSGVAPPGDGGYHHYAATYDGSVGRLYIDATLVATTATAAAPTAAVDRIDMLEHTLSNVFTDDLRFLDTALSQSEIATLMGTPVGSAPPAFSGTVTLSASASMTVAGVRSSAGAVGLSAAGGIAASGVHASVGTVGLAAVAGVTAGAVRASAGSAPLAAAAGVAAAGVRGSAGGVALEATGSLALAGVRSTSAAAGLTAGAAVLVSGASARSGTVTLAATAGLTAHQVVDLGPAPPESTYVVPAESRVFVVPAESRVTEA